MIYRAYVILSKNSIDTTLTIQSNCQFLAFTIIRRDDSHMVGNTLYSVVWGHDEKSDLIYNTLFFTYINFVVCVWFDSAFI